MAGWLTNGVNQIVTLTGAEQLSLDTGLSGGRPPQTGEVLLTQLATMVSNIINTPSAGKTMVANTKYVTGFTVGQTQLLTGIQVLVQGTGGTDNWYVELHDSAGVGLVQSAATVAGTAGLWQQIPFTATYTVTPGQYFLALVSNGTTAKFATYNTAGLSLLTGTAATGTAGTLATIAVPTTYTANVGPQALPY